MAQDALDLFKGNSALGLAKRLLVDTNIVSNRLSWEAEGMQVKGMLAKLCEKL